MLSTESTAVHSDDVHTSNDIGQRHRTNNDIENILSTNHILNPDTLANFTNQISFPIENAPDENEIQNGDDNILPISASSHTQQSILNEPRGSENSIENDHFVMALDELPPQGGLDELPPQEGMEEFPPQNEMNESPRQEELNEVLHQEGLDEYPSREELHEPHEPIQAIQSNEHRNKEPADVRPIRNYTLPDDGSLQKTTVSVTLVGGITSMERNNFGALTNASEFTVCTPPATPEFTADEQPIHVPSTGNNEMGNSTDVPNRIGTTNKIVETTNKIVTSTPVYHITRPHRPDGNKRIRFDLDADQKATTAKKINTSKDQQKINFTFFKCDKCIFVSMKRELLAKHKNTH